MEKVLERKHLFSQFLFSLTSLPIHEFQLGACKGFGLIWTKILFLRPPLFKKKKKGIAKNE